MGNGVEKLYECNVTVGVAKNGRFGSSIRSFLKDKSWTSSLPRAFLFLCFASCSDSEQYFPRSHDCSLAHPLRPAPHRKAARFPRSSVETTPEDSTIEETNTLRQRRQSGSKHIYRIDSCSTQFATEDQADRTPLAVPGLSLDALAATRDPPSALMPDMTEVGRFIELLFCHANGEHWISLRAFRHQEGTPPLFIGRRQTLCTGLGGAHQTMHRDYRQSPGGGGVFPARCHFTSRYSAWRKDRCYQSNATSRRWRRDCGSASCFGLPTAKRLAIFRPCKISLLSVTSFRSDHLLRRIMVLAR